MFSVKLVLLALFGYSLAFYEDSQYVKELNVNNFETEVIDHEDIWLIQFFSRDSDECSEYFDVYENVGKALKGFMKVGAVDVNKDRLLAYRYNIKKLPTLIHIYKNKTSMKYGGDKSEIALINHATELITKQINDNLEKKFVDLPFVKELTKSDIVKLAKESGRWIVAYYNSEDAEDDNFKKTFVGLANKLHDIIKFGYHDINKSDGIDKVKNIPTIVYYFGSKRKRNVMEYNGTMDQIDEVVSWALSNIRKPEVKEFDEENSLKDACIKRKYCIITVIESSDDCDTPCKNMLKKKLSQLAENYKKYSATWALVRRYTMSNLEEIFDIGDSSEFPVMLVVDVQTLKSKELENFAEIKAQEFLENIFNGSALPQHRRPGFDSLLENHYTPWHDEL